jgi:hypothetical protein
MKQVSSLLCLRITFLFAAQLLLGNLKSSAQLTYIWNKTGTADWQIAANWTPGRTSPAADDILIFNNGVNNTVTNIPIETIGQLQVSTNTSVTLEASAPAIVLAISGGAGDDLTVTTGSTLNIFGNTNDLTISLSTGATGLINGTMDFSASTVNTPHKLLAADANGIIFNSPGVFKQGLRCTGNVFGNSGLSNTIIFNSGTTFIQNGGAIPNSNPFALAAPSSKVVFNTGSLYKHQQTGVPSMSGRIYADFELDYGPANLPVTGGTATNIDNLTITTGILNLNLTGGVNLKGNISVAAGQTLTFSPAGASVLTFNGTAPQNITNNGILTFGVNEDVVVNNTTGLILNSSVMLNKNLIFSNGKIILGNNNLTINNNAPGAIAGYGATKYIVADGTGVLKRFIAAAAASYDFPIGNNLFYKPATINFTTAPTAAGSLSARFNTGFVFFPNTIPINEGGVKVNATSIQGTWFIDAGDGLTGGIYDGTFAGNGAIDVIDYLKLVLVKRPSVPANEDWVLEGTHVTTTGLNTAPVLKRSGMTGFSEFGIGGELTIALPVKLNYINVTKQNGIHTIAWKITCTNNPNAIMSLERSADNRNFTGINTIVADALRCQQPFAYSDNAPLAGINYYRLKMMDNNGKITYSNAIAILNKDAGFDIVGLLPTIVSNNALLNVTAAQKTKMQVVVTDIAGRQVQKIGYNLIAGSSQFTISLSNLSAGTYQITGYTEEDKSRTIRFVKQ